MSRECPLTCAYCTYIFGLVEKNILSEGDMSQQKAFLQNYKSVSSLNWACSCGHVRDGRPITCSCKSIICTQNVRHEWSSLNHCWRALRNQGGKECFEEDPGCGREGLCLKGGGCCLIRCFFRNLTIFLLKRRKIW